MEHVSLEVGLEVHVPASVFGIKYTASIHAVRGQEVDLYFSVDNSVSAFRAETAIKWLTARDTTEPATPQGERTRSRVEEPPAVEKWLWQGHASIGAKVLREFGGVPIFGQVSCWLPAAEAEGEGALFRVLHEDGDEVSPQLRP